MNVSRSYATAMPPVVVLSEFRAAPFAMPNSASNPDATGAAFPNVPAHHQRKLPGENATSVVFPDVSHLSSTVIVGVSSRSSQHVNDEFSPS